VKQYLDMLYQIVSHGSPKVPSRAESGDVKETIGLPNLIFTHNLSWGFPLLTTRKLAWKGLKGELRSFLCGDTDNRQFTENGCNFWTPWARSDHDLGPIYGAQWIEHGQLDHVLKSLRERPTDRRMVVSAWRPDEHHNMVLPPCHVMWIVTPYDNKLNLSWIQRSADFPIGVPYNIASYALLTHLLAEWAGMDPGNLSCIFCDAHIYTNQLPGVYEQLARAPRKLPELSVSFAEKDNFYSWDCELTGWSPQPNIDFGELVV